MRSTPDKKRFHWGWGIVALYGGFVIFMLGIVAYASLQHFDLVDKDYYARGVDYERQIERIKRADSLEFQPTLTVEPATGELLLRFPQGGSPGDISGTVTLFRPSAASLDFVVPLQLGADFTQRIKPDRLANGMYRTKLLWVVAGKEYYQERELLLE